MTENLSRVNAPSAFRQHIKVAYPPGNKPIFEEWFRDNYLGCNTERIYLDIFPTSYWVNNDYGNNARARQDLQEYINELDRSKKYFTICQYDDGVLVDWKGLDVLEFNMSKNIGVTMPLLCQPHPFQFKGSKKWLANFVGSRTHEIRNHIDAMKNDPGYYISFEPHNIEQYCRVMFESIFTICPRGYGANSFRTAEALQYGSIPVYVSDEFINPYDLNFEYFGVLINEHNAPNIDRILLKIEPEEIIKMQERIPEVYNNYYTFEGSLKQIIKNLETEYNSREQV